MPAKDTEKELHHRYNTVQRHGGWLAVPAGGLLNITGPDQIDFVQRQTTNDLRRLQPGQVITTVLTSPTARILDVLRVYSRNEHLQIITLLGNGHKTFNFLKSRIFFKDNVILQDLSSQFIQIELVSPAFPDSLIKLDQNFDPYTGVQELKIQEFTAVFVPGEHFLTLGSFLVLPGEALPAWEKWAAQQEWVEIDPQLKEILRVEAGLPGPDRELSEDYTPLEVGLSRAISSSKGCYTGQEVIARQITYDKIVKQLYQLSLSAVVSVGTTVEFDGIPAGEITSCVLSPRYGSIALAVLKTKQVETGSAPSLRPEREVVAALQAEPWNRT